MIKRKIKIIDDDNLRNKIWDIYETKSQTIMAKWSLDIAKRMIKKSKIDISKYPEIKEGFKINELWQKNEARMYDVRKIGLQIHKKAREQDNEIFKSVLRVVGQAVASGHMKEHSIVASDYAIKVINLMFNNDLNKVIEERNIQLEMLKKY